MKKHRIHDEHPAAERRPSLPARGAKLLAAGLLALGLTFSFTGCAPGLLGGGQAKEAGLPKADENGMVTIGRKLKMKEKSGSFVFNEYNDALAANAMYYATWTSGEPSDYTNSDGEEAKLYEAQIYVLVYEGTNADDAASKVPGWMAAAKEQYEISEERTVELGGTEYTILEYTTPQDTTPFEGGISAFYLAGDVAACAELQYTPGWEGDPEEALMDFLS